MNRIGIVMAGAALLAGIPACGDDDEATSFTANLVGTEEFPAVTTTATGNATFEIVGNQIEYTVTVAGIENVLVAHIHVAPRGQNGPVRLNLCGTGAPQPACTGGTGILATGTNGTVVGTPPMTFEELVSEMRAGNAYTYVHTQQNPNGEIRGQIEPQ